MVLDGLVDQARKAVANDTPPLGLDLPDLQAELAIPLAALLIEYPIAYAPEPEYLLHPQSLSSISLDIYS